MPSHDLCFWKLCFEPLTVERPQLFGYAEFLAALALMVLAWTTADIRYRFRIHIAPVPLRAITFSVVAGVGALTLLTDLWIAENYLVLRGDLISTAQWQAVLGFSFLMTFLLWAWFAFILPAKFGPRNAERFANAFYACILKGDSNELAVLADELSRSARRIVHYAPDKRSTNGSDPKVSQYAHDLLLLIGDRRFCRSIISHSPGTALAFFSEIAQHKKHHIAIGIFGQNLVSEALANKDSFLFHETEGYQTGLIGYMKPLSQAIFANYQLVEAVGTLLDPWADTKLDASQCRAYNRAVLLTLENYLLCGGGQHSYVLHRAIDRCCRACHDMYKLDAVDNVAWDNDSLQRVHATVDFIKTALSLVDGKMPPKIFLRNRNNETWRESPIDLLVDAAVEVIYQASNVRTPRKLAWEVQHNTVWRAFFGFGSSSGPASKVFRFKLRRMIFDRVKHLDRFGDYQSAHLLGFCLNVMGLEVHEHKIEDDSRALHKTILDWTTKRYPALWQRDRDVAQACLLDALTFDPDTNILRREYGLGRRKDSGYAVLQLDPIPET